MLHIRYAPLVSVPFIYCDASPYNSIYTKVMSYSNEIMHLHPIKIVRNGHDALQYYRQDQFFLNLHEKWI